jgi:hypothetical protein
LIEGEDMPAFAQLDKSVSSDLSEGYGTITIRVVVMGKALAPAQAPNAADDIPADMSPDEVLPDKDKRPTATFLEEPKRGRQCCVFLINGQRQHAWDNQFIVRDLDLKYLRNRMLVVVDCDGLKPDAIARLMQGSRFQFLEGTVYAALESRVLATLKGDPDLHRLEEEAEEDISSLQAGDEAVKAASDQLIEAHHDAGVNAAHGNVEAGEATRDGKIPEGNLQQSQTTVKDGQSGDIASDPVLLLQPDVATVRLQPDESRRLAIHTRPDLMWKDLETMLLTFDPPIKELQASRTSQLMGEEVTLKFEEPDDIDEDEYPVETALQITAIFKGLAEPRILERRVVINRSKKKPKPTPVILKSDPTKMKVTSRQPIKIVVGGPDVHVKLWWDGLDELVNSPTPEWAFQVLCESPSVDPATFLTRPVNGRFELLIQAAPGLKSGEQLKFTVDAVGPGKTLTTAFLADVVEPLSPRKLSQKVAGGAQRRPPYALIYVTKDNWGTETCWGGQWGGQDPGSFDPPSSKSPLTIFINTETDLLTSYRDSLLSKKYAETTIQQRINKYTAHVALQITESLDIHPVNNFRDRHPDLSKIFARNLLQEESIELFYGSGIPYLADLIYPIEALLILFAQILVVTKRKEILDIADVNLSRDAQGIFAANRLPEPINLRLPSHGRDKILFDVDPEVPRNAVSPNLFSSMLRHGTESCLVDTS